ncbi:MAG: leucyl aminopeptidase, partial [Alphaproteobacteria bacterium]|nr:leucyl aminopeptidase [Alphaproteobacteria bacterium]
MTETLKIDFADLSKINVLSQVGAREASGKAEKSRTVVIFAGQDLSFGPTTLQLIGETGEALVKK